MCENDCELEGERTPLDGQTLLVVLSEYIRSCESDREKPGVGRFPNLAGFCRYCCFGASELKAFARKYPREYELMCSVFEDEALNSNISATLISAYLKNHFGYGERAGERTKVDSGDIKLMFEHDILADGE